MWIEELDIAGFGKLTGSHRFGSGLNVVSGPNEAGKSTLHRALIVAMFGFTSSERRRSRGSSALSELAPWDDGAFSMIATVHTESSELRIEWAFDAPASAQSLALFDDATGKDLSDQVRLAHGDVNLGRFLLALDHEEYCQMCAVEQAAIGAVRRTDSLEGELRRAAEVGNADVGVDRAVEILDDAFRSDAIGVRRDTYSSLKRGALRRAETKQAEVLAGIKRAEEAREELERATQEDAARRSDKSAADQTILRIEQGLLLTRVRELSSRVAAADKASETARVEGEPTPPVEENHAQRIRALRERLAGLGEQIRVNAPAATASNEDLTRLQRQVNDLDLEMVPLAPYESIDNTERVDVEVSLRRLQDARPPETPSTPPPVVADSKGLSPAVVAVAVAAFSLIGGALITPAMFAGLVVAVAIYYLLSRGGNPVAEGAPATKPLPPTDERPALRATLTQALDAVGAPPSSAVEERAVAYIAGCEKRAQLEVLRARRLELDLQRKNLQTPLVEQERLANEQASVTEELRGALETLGIQDSGPAGLAEFEQLARKAEERRDAAKRAEGAREALDAALAGQSMADLRAELARAEADLEVHRATHGEFADDPAPEPELERELREARGRREELATQLGASGTRLEQLEAEQEHVPQLRAELETQAARISSIGQAARVIATAKEELEKAAAHAHRRFAPILNRAIEQDLPSITGGRYREARVSEGLEITLVAPETNSLVSAERLSRGTRDQIYLVERLAILDVLASTARESAPLLLDDAFAYFDDDRLHGGLELLARKATDRQVVLLVDDPRIPVALAELGIEHDHLELEGPAGGFE